jgi:FkbM family methyltransferase
MVARGSAHGVASAARDFARRLGVSIEKYPPPGSLEHNLIQITKALHINCVVDVGAHCGEFATRLRTIVHYHGRIVSFEPALGAFNQLTDVMKNDSQWRGVKKALGNAPGRAELALIGEGNFSHFSSFHDPNEFGKSRFGSTFTKLGTETVDVQRLDGVLDEILVGIEKPRVLLKIDTQGHDLAVIEGAGDRINDIAAVLLEAPTLPIYDDIPTMDVLLVEMRNRGFDPCNIFPIMRTSDWLRMIEFDCTFVNRALSAAA